MDNIERRNFNTRLSKICITIIILTLMWHYGFTSYLSNYAQIDETGQIITYSIPIVNLVSRVSSMLSYISCFWLFFNKFWKKRYVTPMEFVYVLIIANMLCVLLFSTNDAAAVLFDLGAWNNRMGLITVFACSIYFYAYDNIYWEYIKKLICILVLIIALLLTVFMLTEPEIYSRRLFAYKWLHGFGVIVRLGIWLFIGTNKKKKFLSVYVLLVDMIMIVCLQARLYIIDFALQLVFIFILLLKNKNYIKGDKSFRIIKAMVNVALIGLIILLVAIMMPNSSVANVFPENVQNSLEMFSERLNEDTRTEQARGFFEYFWDSFPFGVGYNTEGIPSGVGEDGIDCGYLNTMYITGLPMVILLFAFTAFPIYRCWFRKNNIEQIVVIARATTWTIILLSSATTGFEIEFIYFIICAGRCAGWVEKKK